MKFIFIYSNAESSDRVSKRLQAAFSELTHINMDSVNCTLLTTESNSRVFLKENKVTGLINGYVRYPDCMSYDNVQHHNKKFFKEMLGENFPLNEDVAHSFATFVFDAKEKQVVIANDLLGFYPIYYAVKDSQLFITSHLLLLSQVFNAEIDYTGVVQKLTGPEFCNFGSRTILKSVHRLLPGEYIKFNIPNNFAAAHKYDNSLYANNFNSNLEDSAEMVWDVVKTESQLCFEYDKEVAIGLSGGMDSRILLASIPKNKEINCYTYGYETYYETKIARRCANAVDANFQSFPEDTMLFPKRDKLKKYVWETEAVGITPWLSILEYISTDENGKIPMALGDSCEAIPGRNIKAYSSREVRIKSFLGISKIEWTQLNRERFNVWKQKNTLVILNKVAKAGFRFEFVREKVIAETTADLESLYRRIESHDCKYVELLDELFSWYVHSRFPISNQLLMLRTKFYPVCPTMSAGSLRAVSCVHPSLRLNAALMDQIFRLPELWKLSRIPTAQIPFIGYDSNKTVKLLMWGIRSKIDQLLIKQASKRKKPTARNRLLKSINWANAYQQADPETIDSWFRPDFIGGEKFTTIFADRVSQKTHPLTPYDIVSAAGVNLEIEYITNSM